MTDFIDLKGLSGAAYRLRLTQPDALPVSAGNFVCVADARDRRRVVCCGMALSLAKARSAWTDAQRQYGATRLFVRLNVASSTRVAEHSDLVAAFQPPMVVVEPE